MRLLKKKKHRHGSSIVYIFCPFSIFLIFPVTTRSSFLPAVGTIACYGVHRRGCPYTYYQTRQRHKLREHFGISPFFFSFHVDDNNSPRAHTHTHTHPLYECIFLLRPIQDLGHLIPSVAHATRQIFRRFERITEPRVCH